MPIPILEIPFDAEGIFISRPNRFLGIVDIKGKRTSRGIEVHVHDPGRLKELLYPGNRVLLKRAESNSSRKTKWDLIAAWSYDGWVLVNSGYHRSVVEHLLQDGRISPFKNLKEVKAEVTMGHSRIDFLLTTKQGKKIGVETKGCTLTLDGIALFPDAPTERGRRHIETLMKMKKTGMDAALMILIFGPRPRCFAPKADTDPKFSEAFYNALKGGLKVYPLLFNYKGGTVHYLQRVPLCKKR